MLIKLYYLKATRSTLLSFMISIDPFRTNTLAMSDKKAKTRSIDAPLLSYTSRESSLPAIHKSDGSPKDFSAKVLSYRELKRLGNKFSSLDAAAATDRLPVVRHVLKIDSRLEEKSQSHTHRDQLQSHSSFPLKKTNSFSTNFWQRLPLEESSLPTDPKTKTSLTFDMKSEKSKASRLKLSYSKINFYTVKDSDLFVLTQVPKPKPPEASSLQVQQGKQTAVLKSRLLLAKTAVAEDPEFADLRLTDTFQLRLVITQEDKQGLSCFEKAIPTLKLVENYTIFHYLHFDNSRQAATAEKKHRFLKKLRTFLQKGSAGAYELPSLTRHLRERFGSLEQPKRSFLHSTRYFSLHQFEQLLLLYLFLEYQPSMTVDKINRIIEKLKKEEAEKDSLLKKQLSIKELPEVERTPEAAAEPLDIAQREKQILEEADRILDLKPQTLKTHPAAGPKYPDDKGFVYQSINLRRIELCLQHQDILFDMDAPVFNRLLDLAGFEADPDQVSRYPMADDKKKIYFELIAVRNATREQVKTVGNDLIDDLDLLRVPEDSYYSDHSSEGLKQDSSETGQSQDITEAVVTQDQPS